MSGGHYDYAFGHLNTLAMNIKADCEQYATDHRDAWGNEIKAMPPDILAHMRYIADQLEALAMAAHDIEWLMSYDYGYDTLREHCESWKLSGHLRLPAPPTEEQRP